MNFSTKQMAMAGLAGLGLFAVLLAYRSGQQSDSSFEVEPHDFSSLNDLAYQNLLDMKPRAMSAPPVLPATAPPVEHVASMPSMPKAQAEPDWDPVQMEPGAADPVSDFEAQMESVGSKVQSFNYLPEPGAAPIPMMENVSASVQPEVAPEPPATMSRGVKPANWQKNPYVGKKQATMMEDPATTGTPSLLESPVETEDLSMPAMDFSSTGATAIGSIVADTKSADLKIDSTMEADRPAQAAQYSAPVARAAEQVAPPMPASASTPIIAGLDRSAGTEAVHHIEYGKSLARRSAVEAATQEFFSALHVLAQSNDQQTQSNQYTKALRAGVTAMKEAEDFMIEDPQYQVHMDVGSVVETHQTELIGQTRARNMTGTQAMQEYFEYAGQQLGLCGGQNVVAAEALYCLGKLTSIRAMADPNPQNFETAKAVIYHRASMGADLENHRSANELGVLLARKGRLPEAEAWLKKSLMINPVAQSWGNLAKVHQRKGTPKDLDLATKANREHELAMHNEVIGAPVNRIRWLEPAEFIKSTPMDAAEAMADARQAVGQAVVPVANIEEANGQQHKSIAEKIRNWAPGAVLRR